MSIPTRSSLLHDLHPAVKLAWLLSVTIAVFVADSVVLPLAAAGAAIALVWYAGLPPWRVTGMRVWLVLALTIFAAHALFSGNGGGVLGPISVGGLAAGARAAGRLLAVVTWSALLVTTTDPALLAQALIGLGLPYRWGFALVTALRLASVFRIEAHHVYRAQLVRGVGFDLRGPRRWWALLRRWCLPLLLSALRTAQSLSLSMEGRAFGLHTQRTYTRELRVTFRDAAVIALLLLLLLASGIAG